MLKRNMVYCFALIVLVGCTNKLFQPTPPEFKMWIIPGGTEDNVKKAMLECGYPNIGGFSGVKSTVDEQARAEQCMFRLGFRYKDGWAGVCSLGGNSQVLQACKQ